MTKKKGKDKKGKSIDILLAPFLPLVGIAKRIYRRKTGKKPPKEPKDLLVAFYRDVLNRKYEYDYQLEPATIGMMVGAVVSFIADLIKKSKEKKKRGEQLSEEEQEMANSNGDQAEQFLGNPGDLVRIAEYVPLMEEYYREVTGNALEGDIFTKIKRFYRDVVQRSPQFDFDLSQFEASFANRAITGDELYQYEYDLEYDIEYNLDAATVISSIIAFFQRFRDRVREKQRRGQQVSRFEARIADAVDRIERRAISEAQQTVSQQVHQSVGRTVVRATPIILIGLAALVAYVIASRKR